jgi:UDPglucose 6-dehydrogenase
MKAYDPEAIQTFRRAASKETLSKMEFMQDRDSVIEDVDALIICTEWNEFRRPDMNRFAQVMKEPVIFDGRNLYDLERAREAGLTYISVGRPSVNL